MMGPVIREQSSNCKPTGVRSRCIRVNSGHTEHLSVPINHPFQVSSLYTEVMQGWGDDNLIHIHRSITDLQLFIVDGTDTQNSGQYISCRNPCRESFKLDNVIYLRLKTILIGRTKKGKE